MASPDKSMLSEIIRGISDRIAARGGESLSFGPIHQEDGITIIPVTEVRYLFGFGFGHGPKIDDADPTNHGSGGGGGGGSWSRPIGYIRISEGRADFVPVTDINQLIVIAALASGFIAFTFAALRSRRHSRWSRRG